MNNPKETYTKTKRTLSDNMERISAQYFCDNIDDVLDRVEREGVAFVILDDKVEESCVLCPMDNVTPIHHCRTE